MPRNSFQLPVCITSILSSHLLLSSEWLSYSFKSPRGSLRIDRQHRFGGQFTAQLILQKCVQKCTVPDVCCGSYFIFLKFKRDIYFIAKCCATLSHSAGKLFEYLILWCPGIFEITCQLRRCFPFVFRWNKGGNDVTGATLMPRTFQNDLDIVMHAWLGYGDSFPAATNWLRISWIPWHKSDSWADYSQSSK